MKRRKKSAPKPVPVQFELRVFSSDCFREDSMLFAVPYQILGLKAGYGENAVSTADAKGRAIGFKIWAYLHAPNEKNEAIAAHFLVT